MVIRKRLAATALAMAALACAVAVAGCSQDEGSYQYGRSALATDARMLLSTSGPGSAVQSAEDACRIVVDSSMKVDTPQAESMRKMDKDDMIAGCTDAVNGD
jgi:uncharacterized lipoprotein YehR (DUF1307 family)